MTARSTLYEVLGDVGSGPRVEDDEREAAHHVRTQLLRRVAHDIASPTGVTLTVLDELAGTDRPRPELVAMAKRSLRRLMRLSEHLALVAELETEPIVPELAPVDVRALATQALDDAIAIDGRKDVIATADLPQTPLVIEGDARLLVIVFREILGNALKLASSRVELMVGTGDDGVTLVRVDDDGPGFGEEAARTLGRRFLPRSASRGLGLSLSMAKDILGAHGAELETMASALPSGRRGTVGAAVVVRFGEPRHRICTPTTELRQREK